MALAGPYLLIGFFFFPSTDAGHTIVHENVTYDFHILPSGLISPKCVNLIGAGTVVHVPSFFKELAALEEKGLTTAGKRIFISDRAHVCFQLHSVVDGLEEAKLGGRKVGTTGKGIGPCYSDKAARRGVRVGEILDEAVFERKLRLLDAGYRARFGELEYDVEDEIAQFKVCPPLHLQPNERRSILTVDLGIPQNPEALRR